MSKFDRLLFILQLIKVKNYLSAKALAEECDVSERTIYRDVKSLSEKTGVSIYYDKGYKLLAEAFLPILNFSQDELITLWIGLHSDPVKANGQFIKIAKSILTKVESQLPENVRRIFHLQRQFIKIESKQTASMKEAVNFQILKQAISEFKRIDFVHEESGTQHNYKDIEPKELVWKQNKWNLSGLWQGKEKTFELGKIINITLRQIENK